jgi:hypothetical protein
MLRRLLQQQEIQAVVGAPFFTHVTALRAPQGRLLGPARVYPASGHVVTAGRRYSLLSRDGSEELVWSFWAPLRSLLVDIFERELPSDLEMDCRENFARTHDLRYAVVPPGYILTLADLRELVAETPVTSSRTLRRTH